jgi:homogentisate 1,2-dioxygenase
MYRIRPSVTHRPFSKLDNGLITNDFSKSEPNPNQLRWKPIPVPDASIPTDFIQGMKSLAGCGDPCLKSGLTIHYYTANISMIDKAFYNSDGDFLIGN